MHPNETVIADFYTAFQKHDAAGMVIHYAPTIHFSDSVFVDLHGSQAVAMWQMLAGRTTDLALTFDAIKADDQRGSAHWEGIYTFSKTGRKVHNKVDAQFIFKNGKIVDHHDQFDLWAWTRMALGTSGLLLGWTPFLQHKVQHESMETLASYLQKHPQLSGV